MGLHSMARLPADRPPTHPGVMLLEEFLKPLGMTQVELAEKILVSYRRINVIVNRKRGITPDPALRLSALAVRIPRHRTARARGGRNLCHRNSGSTMKYRVLIERDEDGVFVATVPSLPGCVADGPTREAALDSVREAIALYIESLENHGDPIPPPITEELVEV